MSEYGFQSFPELNTVAKYALPEEWDIESEVMAAHQRSGIGNLRIKQYMENDYVIPGDFEHFLYVSQLLQAEGIKIAIESHRADMPYCMGSLYWQLNDCWPVASWSGIDYYGRWKALHHFVKKAFEQSVIVCFNEDDQVKTFVISDDLTDQNATLKQRLLDFNGAVLWELDQQLTIAANSSTKLQPIARSDFEAIGDISRMVLVSALLNGKDVICENKHYFVKPKELQLDDPELTYDVTQKEDEFVIKLQSSKLAKNVFLSTNLSADHFSDNYFDVLPGKPVQINYPKIASIDDFETSLKVLSLYNTLPHVENK
jgi:beta-mannosidase